MDMNNDILVEAHISDIHFGVFDPSKQYEILKTQFIDRIAILNKLDLISINGDLFHHKFMANSDAVVYAMKFVDDLVKLTAEKNCTLFILHGTPSHDANQTRLFYRYQNSGVDVRVIETVRFEYVKNKKILCIPEIPGLGREYYENILNNNFYDAVCMHGTIRGAIFGKDKEDLDLPSPVFSMDNFKLSGGPVISGHVHKPGCFEKHFYYCGSPYRWCYGEEEEKGFIILLHNIKTRKYYIHFQPIESYRYDTINFDEMIKDDPANIINYIKQRQAEGIHNIRMEFTVDHSNINILKQFYRNNPHVAIKCDYKNDIIRQQSKEALDQYKEYNFITDKSLSEYDILSKYINQNMGYMYITTEELIDILKE